MSILIPERENDQYREGHVVNIGLTGKLTCPVAYSSEAYSSGYDRVFHL